MSSSLALFALQLATWTFGTALPDYNCSAPLGHFERMNLSGNEAGFRISGTIKATEFPRGSSSWNPAAGVMFQPTEGKGGLGLQIWKASRKTLTYGLHQLGPNADLPVPLGELPLDEPIQFVLSLDKDGELVLQVNDKAFALSKAGVGPQKPFLMCSGGNFVFEDLITSMQ